MKKPISILIVDDILPNIQLLSAMLLREGFDVRPTSSGPQAIRAAKANPPDLVLLDIRMPEMSGYEVCRIFKQDEDLADIPIIFLSAVDDVQSKVAAFNAGGVDYITKPFQSVEVLMRVNTHLTLRRQQRELEAWVENERSLMQKINALKDEILSTVSHDLKNPIHNVQNALSLLQDELRADPALLERTQPMLQAIENSADQMQHLVVDVLNLARFEGQRSVQRSSVALCTRLAEWVTAFQFAQAAEGVTLHIGDCPPDLHVRIDPVAFRRVVENLLSNAYKFTPPGGTVTVRVEHQEDAVQIIVEDTGIGIPQAALERIFDKFYRVDHPAHRARGGTGLGMSIVQAIVQQHGGSIDIASEEGVGTRVTVSIPS